MKESTTQSQAPYITNDSCSVRHGYKWTEVGLIPEDWEIQRLDDFCSVYSGGTPSTTRQDFYGGHIPWINSGDLNARRITEVSNYLTQAGFDSSAAKMIESGDLVIALYGATAGVVAVTEIEAAINQAVLAIKTNRCDSEYLFHHLASRKNQIVATYTQGGQPNLSGEIIRSLIILIPPLVEQRAIAAVLSDVDGLINALNALIAKKRAIKQATMQQLLTGKTRLPGFSGRWKTVKMGQIGSIYGGLSGKNKNDFEGGNARYVTFLGVLENVTLDMRHTERVHVRHGESQNSVMKEDLLFNASSETPGDLAIGAVMAEQLENLYLNSFCFGFRIHDKNKYMPLFFAYYFRGSIGRAIMNALAQGATRYNMSKNQFRALELSIPSGTEQRAIAAVLSDMDAEIAALEQRRDKTIAIKQGMMQQLLTGRVRLSESRIRDVWCL